MTKRPFLSVETRSAKRMKSDNVMTPTKASPQLDKRHYCFDHFCMLNTPPNCFTIESSFEVFEEMYLDDDFNLLNAGVVLRKIVRRGITIFEQSFSFDVVGIPIIDEESYKSFFKNCAAFCSFACCPSFQYLL